MKASWMVLALAWMLSALGQAGQLTVTARDRDYDGALVIAPVPAEFPRVGWLKSGEYGDTAFQRDEDGNIVFVLGALKRGARATFSVSAESAPTYASADLRDGIVQLAADGKPVLTYHGAKSKFPRPDIQPIYARGGYIHPVFSPSGKWITDDFPTNHVHHHGIWAPWTKTVFQGRSPDFWNMGEGKGKVEFAGFDGHWSGPVHAGFKARHRFVDLTAKEPVAALDESWKVTSYRIPGANYFVFDLVTTQRCATVSALELPKYHYGGLGLRGNGAWNGVKNAFFLTSNGETDRVKGNETPGRWCHMGGAVEGGLTGIAALGHPGNFRAPQGMRLHPSEPFFCYAPSQGGDWAIEPGRPYVARFRFVAKDGPPDKAELDRFWEDYAHPPEVLVAERKE